MLYFWIHSGFQQHPLPSEISVPDSCVPTSYNPPFEPPFWRYTPAAAPSRHFHYTILVGESLSGSVPPDLSLFVFKIKAPFPKPFPAPISAAYFQAALCAVSSVGTLISWHTVRRTCITHGEKAILFSRYNEELAFLLTLSLINMLVPPVFLQTSSTVYI